MKKNKLKEKKKKKQTNKKAVYTFSVNNVEKLIQDSPREFLNFKEHFAL